jgi:hypothetical protein
MKKFLFGIAAVVLAVTLSAFDFSSSEVKPASITAAQYWYSVVSSGGQLYTNAVQFSGTPMLENDAINAQPCKDVISRPICLAGFNTAVGPGIQVTTTAEPELIRQQNP